MLLNASTRRRSSSADLHGDPRVEVAARDPPRRARQAADRIGDALGHRQADRGAEQDEEQRREVDAAIELVDLALDLLLARGQRHRQDAVAAGGAHRRRGDHVGNGADLILVDEARQPLQHDRAIDVVRRSRRQEARREQIALARGDELGAVEDVDVLVDDLADPHHHVVVDRADALGAAAQQRIGFLDDALRDGRRPRRLGLDVGAQQVGEVGADHEREDQHRDDRRGDEREEQLAVEAGADLAQQRAADARPLRGSGA